MTAIHEEGRLLKIDSTSKAKDISAKQLEKLLHHPDVEYVVENIKMRAFDAPNDPMFSQKWDLQKMNLVPAWDISKGSKGVVVAVIDTGVDMSHEDLNADIWTNTKEIPNNGIDDDQNGFVDDVHGWDFFANNNSPNDQTSAQNPGHGTHVAGIIGAVGNNNIGVCGVNQTVSIMPIRFLGADGSGDLFNSVKAIDYAVANGANVINASWGAAVPRSGAQPIIDAIERARQKGVIFVAAAANDGRSNDVREVYPANAGLDNVISVAASDSNDAKPSWSNYGKSTVDLAAPGVDILSTLPGNKYGPLSGTSMASPEVAGLVALMKSVDMSLNGKQIKSILQTSGAKVNIETACNCRVDANAALNVITQKALTVVPAAASLKVGGKIQFDGYGGTGPYSFASSNQAIATISSSGELTAVSNGEMIVTVTDSVGATANSLTISVGQKSPDNGGGGNCPFGDEMLCRIICGIAPDMPWCDNATPNTPLI